MSQLTRGDILINLYEVGRDLEFDHITAYSLAEQAFDKLYGELELLWYLVYLEARKDFEVFQSREVADSYIQKATELLEQS